MKNILLINPWIYDFTAYDFWLKPLGLLYVASLLKKHTQFQISFIDCLDRHHSLLEKKSKTRPDGRGPFPKEQVPKPAVLKDVPRKYSRYGIPLSIFNHELEQIPLPDLVLITCTMTYWYPGVQIVAELIRKKFGPVPLILGGVYPSLMPEHARSTSGADIVFQGPGEKGILPLIRDILGDSSCPASQFETLDEVPWPDFSLLRNKETLPLLTSRGCPFKCSFCAVPLLFKDFEQRSPSSVIDEIEYHYRQHKVRNFAFYDDALLLNRDRQISSILNGVIQKKLPLHFHTPNGLHVREIDSELAALLKRANFQSLFLSQESFDEKVLKDSCPKVSSEDLEKALVNLERAGYRREDINVYLMVGLPEQDASGIRESIFQVQNLGAKPKLAYFSPVPGTEVWHNLVAKGCIDQDADPLLHNKLVFPYYWGNFSSQEFESLKDLVI
ncbi:MAG: B12-binding domain-containing radical SAM protein [Candidatus Aminicenantes bacterium]|nr:MAG: B12-binding domain-containing radical SAM protein [Candidatus Aminicenantes bacterium]